MGAPKSDIMKNAAEEVAKIYSDVDEKMKQETRRVKTNQSELKSQLQDLVDTEKYLRLIEERNKEIQKRKSAGFKEEKEEVSIYANRQTEIKVDQEVIQRLGLAVAEDGADDHREDFVQKEESGQEIPESFAKSWKHRKSKK